MKYVKSYDNIVNDTIKYMQNKYNLSNDLSNYVYNLGYKTKEDVDCYFNPTSSLFHNPFDFENMAEVVKRITKAIDNGEKIVIFGDYDADGIGATYILIKYFESVGLSVNYFLPSRYQDGYGLTKESIDKVVNMYSPNLIITVDCGITAIDEVEYVKSCGVDIIVTDHHEQKDILPNCLVLDCKIKNSQYPFKSLCGAGMALKLVYALSNYETASKFFTVCAISTIADIVELTDENRFIVKEGLFNYKENCPKGLKYLIKQCKVNKTPTSKDISYKIAPKINATGRMGDASVALKLYLSENDEEIKSLYKQIVKMNEDRQNLCSIISDEAISEIENNEMYKQHNILVLKKENWECGILGIVSSKLVEKYHKPVILMGFDERTKNFSGSARSYADIDIFSAIEENANYLETFGGHKSACGLSLKEENFINFYKNLDSSLNKATKIVETKNYDIEISSKKINLDLLSKLELLEPFGIANPEPIFKLVENSITLSPMTNHNEHLILELENNSALYFGNAQSIYTLSFNIEKSLYATINTDYFMNRKTPKIIILDYQCEEFKPFNEQIACGAYNLLNLVKNDVLICDVQSLKEYKNDNNLKTLFISFKNKNINYQYDCVNYINLKEIEKKTLLISPISFKNLDAFDEIVFLDELNAKNEVYNLKNKYPNIKFYANINKNNEKMEISFSKITTFMNELEKEKNEIFDEIYLFKKKFSKLEYNFTTFITYFSMLSKINVLNFDKSSHLLTINSEELSIEKLSKYNIKITE